jgi:hypothetical protein
VERVIVGEILKRQVLMMKETVCVERKRGNTYATTNS